LFYLFTPLIKKFSPSNIDTSFIPLSQQFFLLELAIFFPSCFFVSLDFTQIDTIKDNFESIKSRTRWQALVQASESNTLSILS